jgi:hypothetical protein
MPIRPLTTGMRVFLGVLGVTAVAAALEVARWDLGRMHAGASRVWGATIGVIMCFVVAGGVRLLMGAARGRIYMREPRRHA